MPLAYQCLGIYFPIIASSLLSSRALFRLNCQLDEETVVEHDLNDHIGSLHTDDEHIIGGDHWANDDDDDDHVNVFPSSAPEVLIETTAPATRKRKAANNSGSSAGNKRGGKRGQGGSSILQQSNQRVVIETENGNKSRYKSKRWRASSVSPCGLLGMMTTKLCLLQI
jgi:hypothetical protein